MARIAAKLMAAQSVVAKVKKKEPKSGAKRKSRTRKKNPKSGR